MKKFFFRLETPPRVRKLREGRIERDLKIAERKLSQVREKKETLEQQIASLIEEISEKRKTQDLALEETYNQILDHLTLSLNQVKNEYAGQEKQVAEHRERVKQAVCERKLIEKLKDRHRSEWRADAEKSEEEDLDEIAATHSQRGA